MNHARAPPTRTGPVAGGTPAVVMVDGMEAVAGGVDYSTDVPSDREMAAVFRQPDGSMRPAEFVVRYVSSPGNRKNLTADEAAWHRAAGRDIAIVFEQSAHRALGGGQLGYADAQSAVLQTINASGPHDAVTFMAVDWDVQDNEMPAVMDYLRGAGTAMGIDRTGVYGGLRVIETAAAHGLAGYFWQTRAWSWDSGANRVMWHPAAHLHQYKIDTPIVPGGANVDLNRAMADDFGQWEGQAGILAGFTEEQLTELIRTAVRDELRARRATGVDTPVEALERIRGATGSAIAANVAAANALASSQRDEMRSIDLKRRTGQLGKAVEIIAARVGADLTGLDLDWPDEGMA